MAQILPYAIPAVAGAALGGPGLGMVGVGGAAQAKQGVLDQQMRLANLMSEGDYRNRELGLRQQEIQSNEALRKQQAQAEQQYRGEMLGEKKGEFGQREEDRQQQFQQAQQFHQDTNDFRKWMGGFAQQMQGERESDKRDQMQQSAQAKINAQITRAQSVLRGGAKAAWAAQGFLTRHAPESLGGGNYEDFEKSYVERNLPKVSSVTPQQMKAVGFSDSEIANVFPDYGEAAVASPSAKLTAASKGAGAAAPQSIKTTMPDSPPGQAYHINGKAYTVKGGVATEVPSGG